MQNCKTICWSALVCTLSGNEAATEITLVRLKLPFNFCSVVYIMIKIMRTKEAIIISRYVPASLFNILYMVKVSCNSVGVTTRWLILLLIRCVQLTTPRYTPVHQYRAHPIAPKPTRTAVGRAPMASSDMSSSSSPTQPSGISTLHWVHIVWTVSL